MKNSKILFVLQFILLVAIPILYLIINIETNIILDILWVISFAQLTKEFIVKILFKKRYCDISSR